jgi:hypothetical protein
MAKVMFANNMIRAGFGYAVKRHLVDRLTVRAKDWKAEW